MKRALVIQEEVGQIDVIKDLTSVFEGIASVRIAHIKDKVVSSKAFFNELWQIYTQLRADPTERMLGQRNRGTHSDKNVLVVVTSEGGLSGDIDSKIISRVQKDYDAKTTEVIVLGSHGATLLAQARIRAVKGYRLPDTDQAPDVGTIIADIMQYRTAAIYYQTYESLGVQSVGRIDLISAVKALGEGSEAGTETISSQDYIFEPSLDEIIEYMESVVLGVTLGQAILESRLAQHASRFNAMSSAKQRAKDMSFDLMLDYRRAKRSESDERLKEVITSLRRL